MDGLTRFIKLPENRSAHRAIVRLANAVGRGADFPLLFLHGPPGSGKSHLVAGLVERIANQSGAKTAQVLSALDLGRTLMLPPPERKDFVRDISACDLLAVEDVQHFPATPAHEFARILDRRASRKRPVVLTSARNPVDLSGPSRVASRYVGGLVVCIAPLGLDSRSQLASSFCSERGLRVTNEVISWLAQDAGGARPMLGQISRLETLAKTYPPPLNMKIVASELGIGPVTDQSRLEAIAQAVAERHRVSLRLLRSASRLKNVVWARQIAMYATRKSGLTLVEIGRYFGNRDHTTVMHSCEKVANRIETDPKLAAELRDFFTTQ